MTINKQSNLYTIAYIAALAVVVGAALAITSLSLHDRQQQNADRDKMRQILAAAHITVPADSVIAAYKRDITDAYIVNAEGKRVEGDAFDVDVDAQTKMPALRRLLPVFECRAADGEMKYILPVYGAGLWGPIWGYVAFDADGSTIYGAYFAHKGETPGLGAEIEKPAFSSEFIGKTVFKQGVFMPVAVVKAGQKPLGGEDYVDGISGGTITSKGVGSMLDNCLVPYRKFLQSLSETTDL